jgi:hypothetical protein
VPIPNGLTLYIDDITSTISPNPFSAPLNCKIHHSISYMYMKSLNHIPSPYLIHSPSSFQVTPCSVPILQFCLSFLIPQSIFKVVSRCIPAVTILNYSQFYPSITLPYLFPSYLPSFNSIQYILLFPLPAEMQCISILLTIILFSFPYSSESHREVPLLQTCSTHKCLYDHVCFWVHIYLLDLSSTYE